MIPRGRHLSLPPECRAPGAWAEITQRFCMCGCGRRAPDVITLQFLRISPAQFAQLEQEHRVVAQTRVGGMHGREVIAGIQISRHELCELLSGRDALLTLAGAQPLRIVMKDG